MTRLAFVWSSALKDSKRRLRDPFALLLWLGIPLAIGSLIVLAMGGRGGSTPQAKVFVVDRDGEFLADLLVQALSSERAGLVSAEVLDEATARERIDRGEGSALLIVPAGFTRAVFREEPCTLELVTNPAQRILPGVIENALAILCEGVFYAHRVFGDEARDIAILSETGRLDDLAIAETSVRIRHDVERVGDYLVPPAIAVTTRVLDQAGGDAPSRSLGALYAPSMLLMALMFMAEGLADDLWRERVLGVLRRIAIAPFGASAALFGKLLSGWFAMLAVSATALVCAALAFDVAWTRIPPAALWSSFAGTVLFSAMIAIKLLARTQRTAGLIGNLILFPVIMLGGSLIPFEAMPDWLARIGRFTPNGAAMEVLKNLLYGEASFSSVAPAVVVLSLFGAAMFALATLRMRAFARG